MNAQLTPVDATVNTLRAELVWITVIMIVLSLGIALFDFKKSVTFPDRSECLREGDGRRQF